MSQRNRAEGWKHAKLSGHQNEALIEAITENDMDDLYYVEDIKKKLTKTAEYGNKTGGSTIQLPFGFVQWHSPKKVIPGCMQFHHNYQKIKDLMEK